MLSMGGGQNNVAHKHTKMTTEPLNKYKSHLFKAKNLNNLIIAITPTQTQRSQQEKNIFGCRCVCVSACNVVCKNVFVQRYVRAMCACVCS